MKVEELGLKEDVRIKTLKSGISSEEKETVLRYDPEGDQWAVYSTYIPHVKRLTTIAEEIKFVEVYRGDVVGASVILKPEQVRLYR